VDLGIARINFQRPLDGIKAALMLANVAKVAWFFRDISRYADNRQQKH